jgi:hypothetical protein
MKLETSTIAGREGADAAIGARKPAAPVAWAAGLPAAALALGYMALHGLVVTCVPKVTLRKVFYFILHLAVAGVTNSLSRSKQVSPQSHRPSLGSG